MRLQDVERLAAVKHWLKTPGTITELAPRSVYDREEDVRALVRLLDAATSRAEVPGRPTREMYASAGNALVRAPWADKIGVHHDAIIDTVWDGLVSAHPPSPPTSRGLPQRDCLQQWAKRAATRCCAGPDQ